MPDSDAAHDRRPVIVVCGYDPDDAVWDPVEDLSGALWSPPGGRAVHVEGDAPDRLFHALSLHLRDRRCRALLLVGRGPAEGGFSLQMRAENLSLTGEGRLDPALPCLARATLPVSEMVRALAAAGLPARATSESGRDAGSYLLFRILAGLPDVTETPAVGLLRVPDDADEAQARQAVKAAVSAVAAQLAPLPRAAVA